MKNEDYYDIHKDDTPSQLLDRLLEVCGIWRNDAVSRKDAAWRRNDEEVTYWDGEIQAMTDRAAWVFGRLYNALLHAARVLTPEEMLAPDGAVWVEYNRDRMNGDSEWMFVDYLIPNGQWPMAFLIRRHGEKVSYSLKIYGLIWRCWDREPSKEQREATPWEVAK